MMLQLASRRLTARIASTNAATAKCCRMSTTVAATTISDVIPSYVTEAPAATITKLDNGVTVASLFSAGATSSYTTTRLTNCGSRHDTIGGEAAILASALGGSVGREHISIPSIHQAGLTGGDISADQLAALKSALALKHSSAGYESQVMDQLHSTAYQTSPSGNSLGNALEGTKDSIGDVEGVAGVLANVVGSDLVVVGTGGGEHERLVEQANAAYGGLKGGGSGKEVGSVGERSHFLGSDVRIRYDSHDTATVALAFEGASWTDPNAMPLALMQTILGSFTASSGLGKNVASAMCQEVADHELASSISAFNLSYSDTGLFGFVSTSPDNKLDDLLWYVMPNMVRMAHGISDEELLRSKLALKTQILMAYDGDISSGEQIATQIQTIGRVMPLAEMVARVDALTMEDVKSAASEVINDEDHALAAIGGIHELPDYNWIRRHSYMLRY